MITVKLPDGSTAQFPDGTSPDVMKAAIQKKFPPTGGQGGGQTPAAASPQPDLIQQLMNSTGATINGLVNGIPVVGPLSQMATDAIGGGIAQLTGGDYGQYVQHQQQLRQQLAQQNPLASIAGNLGGAVASTSALAQLPGMAMALGVARPAGQGVMPLLRQGANAGLSQLGLGTVDSMARGERPGDALMENLGGAGLATALPFAGAAIRAAGRTANNAVVKPVTAMLNPENAAVANLGKAVAADTRAGVRMTAADQATAAQAGIPVVNADRFGSAVRRLARTATNIDLESAARFSRMVDDRFKGQGLRAVNWVKALMNGATDDLALKQSLLEAADKSNAAAYGKAFNDPHASAVWSLPLQDLMQSDAFRKAVRAAESRGSDRAAVAGFMAVKNPFIFNADGSVGIARKADGSTAWPSLQFWDQVKRNLDGMIEDVKPTPFGGNRTRYADLTALKNKLVTALDQVVPSYAQARVGAASFFGASDAIDAGRKAVTMTKEVPELQRAWAKFTPAEKDAASVGYASEIIDNIKAAGDNRNLMISNLFNTPSARARNALFLGEMRARQLEAYVRVESIVDQLRGAVSGNSTTAQQLIAAGALGTGVGLTTGDWRNGLTASVIASLGMRGLKALGKNVDTKIMNAVAERLLSSDPAAMERAIQNAALSKAHMDALEGIMRGLTLLSRGAVSGGVSAAKRGAAAPNFDPALLPGPGGPSGPLRITVSGANQIN